jgi:RNA polymerase sigma-70 factor, ECF subfamily
VAEKENKEVPVEAGPDLDQDRTARFVELLTHHQRDLYVYIDTLLFGDSSTVDVLQNTNLDLWKRSKEFDHTRPFLHWAYRFAFNRVLEFRKRQRRSRLILTDNLVELINDIYVRDKTPVDARLSALQACLRKLNDSQAQLIRDRYVGKMSVKTMAVRLGGTANQISARLYRIRLILSRCIRETLVAEMG